MLIQKSMEKEKEDFGESITGVHSAIKQFVDAKKENGDDDDQDGKKKILKKLVKKSSWDDDED